MPDSPDTPEGTASAEKQPTLVSIPEMPDRLEAAGLKRVGAPRIRQLATEPTFPRPAYERGRLRLWDWSAVLEFFQTRTVRQGERTDLRADSPQEGARHDDHGEQSGAM